MARKKLRKFGAGYPFQVIIYSESPDEAISLFNYEWEDKWEFYKENVYDKPEELRQCLEEVDNVNKFINDKRMEQSPSYRKRYEERKANESGGLFLVVDDEFGFFGPFRVIKPGSKGKDIFRYGSKYFE